MNEDIETNYSKTVEWYKKREKIVFKHILEELTKQSNINESQVVKFEEDFIEAYMDNTRGPYLRNAIIAAVKAARETGQKTVTFKIGKYIFKDIDISGNSKYKDWGSLSEKVSAKAAYDALIKSATNIATAGSDIVSQNKKYLISQAIGGLYNPNETFMRTRAKLGGQDVVSGVRKGRGLSKSKLSKLEVSNEFSFDWEDDKIAQDIFGNQSDQFDYMFTIQNKLWNYYYMNSPKKDKSYLTSSKMRDALNADFNQTNLKTSHFWVDKYAQRYGEYKISQNLKAVLGTTNLFLGLGDRLVPMSEFLSDNRLYINIDAIGEQGVIKNGSDMRPEDGSLIHPVAPNGDIQISILKNRILDKTDYYGLRKKYPKPKKAVIIQGKTTKIEI